MTFHVRPGGTCRLEEHMFLRRRDERLVNASDADQCGLPEPLFQPGDPHIIRGMVPVLIHDFGADQVRAWAQLRLKTSGHAETDEAATILGYGLLDQPLEASRLSAPCNGHRMRR